MNQAVLVISLIVADIIGTGVAWRLLYLLRFESGIFTNPTPASLFWPGVVLSFFWLVIFAIRGRYSNPIALSRFSELEEITKATLIGIVVLFIATMDVPNPVSPTRLLLAYYGGLIILFTGFSRVMIRTYQRRLRWQKKGLWEAIIVGDNETGHKLQLQLDSYPVWGFKISGFVDEAFSNRENTKEYLLGNIEDLPELVRKRNIEWILVAPESEAEKLVTKVLHKCIDLKLRFMLVADQYQMVIGLVHTVEIHGLPLIEVHPQLVSPTIRFFKRAFDIVMGLCMSVVVLAITPFIAILIKSEGPGPIFYTQKRVGRKGQLFTLLKFRSMIDNAESSSGAVWAQKDDPRVTKFGRFLRKSHLDELPQFFNVLLGQMSLVGPRPERPNFVEEFKTIIPLYERRLRVRPGITGWAQVRHKYDESIADVAEKTRYDLFYIDHLSLLIDLKILIATALKMLRGGGHS